MSNRAEQAALKAWPRTMIIVNDSYGNPVPYDGASVQREIFIGGYKQAEKDLALTKDDVWRIFNLVRELQIKYPATEGCLQEVADIINAQHNEKEI